MTATTGSCFGFEVRSTFPLRFLRDAGGVGGTALRIDVHRESGPADAELIAEWLPEDQGFLHARLYERGGRYRLWIDGAGWYLIDPAEPSIAVPEAEEMVRREERMWGLPTLLCFLHRGDLPLHASAVQVGDGALLIGAPARFGKTTLAAAFWRTGYRVLNEDLSCVRLPEPSVLPGPALLRMRLDMAERLGVAADPSAIDDGVRVRLAIGGDRAGDSRPVPLRGIVLLGEESDDLTMTRVPTVEAIPALWQLSFTLPEAEAAAACFRGLTDLASSVPLWELRRPLSVESLPRVVEHIAAHA